MADIFQATIWPFAEKRLEEISSIIKKRYPHITVEKIEFTMSWLDFVRVVYVDDKIKETKLHPKIDVLKRYPKYVYIICIEVKDPKYYYKEDGRKLSSSMALLKKEIRAKFGPKREADKNPLHIPDCVEHSAVYMKALKRLRK